MTTAAGLGAALLLLAFATAVVSQNRTCPYAALNASRIYVSGPWCQGQPGDSCIVDNKCVVQRTNVSFVDASDGVAHTNVDGGGIGVDAIDAIGDLSFLTTPGFAIGNFTLVNVNAIEFGSTLRDVIIYSVGVPAFSSSIQVPDQLTHMALINTATAELPLFSPRSSIIDFKCTHQPLNDTDVMTIPRRVQYLDLRNTSLTRLADLNWTAKSHVFLYNNSIESIVNVTLRKGTLKTFLLSDANISNFIIDPATFDALDALSPYQFLDQAVYAEYGFAADDSYITQDPAVCAAYEGAIKELWAMHFEITRQRYTVCVVSMPDSSFPVVSVVIGASVAALVMAVGIVFCIKRRAHAPVASPEIAYRRQREGSAAAGARLVAIDKPARGIDMAELTLYRLNQQDVVPQKKLASGAYADVLYGTYKGTPVAIKKLLSSRVGVNEVQGLIDEIKLLAGFTSPYIVKLIGCCWDQPSDLECVLEYMNAGDLRDNLTARDAFDFPWNEKIQVIAAVVDGLAYLHSLPVIHRDLKSRNVLMDTTKPAKLTDFGVSKEDTQDTMTVGVGTYRWMAPEILQFNHYSVAADIFSFGMVLAELDTHNIPYADVTNPKNGKPLVDTAIMSMVIAGTIKPTFSDHMPEWVRDMAHQCIATNPEDRPTAMKLSSVLHQHFKHLSKLNSTILTATTSSGSTSVTTC